MRIHSYEACFDGHRNYPTNRFESSAVSNKRQHSIIRTSSRRGRAKIDVLRQFVYCRYTQKYPLATLLRYLSPTIKNLFIDKCDMSYCCTTSTTNISTKTYSDPCTTILLRSRLFQKSLRQHLPKVSRSLDLNTPRAIDAMGVGEQGITSGVRQESPHVQTFFLGCV